MLVTTSRCYDDNVKKECIESCSVVTVTNSILPFEQELERLIETIHTLKEQDMTIVFIRLFLSDPANQSELVMSYFNMDCPVSIIGQVPLSGERVIAWVWMRKGAQVSRIDKQTYTVKWNGVTEIWRGSALSDANGPYNQTVELLNDWSGTLSEQGMSLEDNCVRTWFFVRDIDLNYQGMVDGRNEVFDYHNLTSETHFITSTGIEGRTAIPQHSVMMDALAVQGDGVSVNHLYGMSHLNRTSEYGVRFERGTTVVYNDIKHVYISGTASIDNKGEIVCPHDIEGQTNRMLENVEVLLSEAACSFKDVAVMNVYLRNISDYTTARNIIANRFIDYPITFTLAPVCRPGWLIEMECVAIQAI